MGFLASQSATKIAKFFGFIACFFLVSGYTECQIKTRADREKEQCLWKGGDYTQSPAGGLCHLSLRDMARGEYIDITADITAIVDEQEGGPGTKGHRHYPQCLTENSDPRRNPILPGHMILPSGCLNSKGEQILKPGETPSENLKVQRVFEPGFGDACEAVGGRFRWTLFFAFCEFYTPDRYYDITRDINLMLSDDEQEIPEEFRDLCQAREDAFIIGTRCMDKNLGDVTSVIERIIDPVPPEAATAGRPENEGPQPSENEGTGGETTRTCANSFPSEWWEANCR